MAPVFSDGEVVDGDVPFYGYPFVQLRGVPAMRYQGEQVRRKQGKAMVK